MSTVARSGGRKKGETGRTGGARKGGRISCLLLALSRAQRLFQFAPIESDDNIAAARPFHDSRGRGPRTQRHEFLHPLLILRNIPVFKRGTPLRKPRFLRFAGASSRLGIYYNLHSHRLLSANPIIPHTLNGADAPRSHPGQCFAQHVELLPEGSEARQSRNPRGGQKGFPSGSFLVSL